MASGIRIAGQPAVSAFFTGNGGNGQIGAAFEGDAADAFGIFDVGEVQNVAGNHFGTVQFERGRDVFRIDQHFHSSGQQGNAAALQFDGFGFFGIGHGNRQAQAQRFVQIDGLEIKVHNLLAEWVDLEIAHDNVLGFAIQRQFDQAGMERTFSSA